MRIKKKRKSNCLWDLHADKRKYFYLTVSSHDIRAIFPQSPIGDHTKKKKKEFCVIILFVDDMGMNEWHLWKLTVPCYNHHKDQDKNKNFKKKRNNTQTKKEKEIEMK